MDALAIVFGQYGLPKGHCNKSWDDCDLREPEKERLQTAFSNPISSVVFVQGTTAPIINQLIQQKSKVRGIDLLKRLQNPFQEYDNPDGDVILVYNAERYTGKPEIAISLFKNILNYYRGKDVLVLIESSQSYNFLRDSYGLDCSNKIKVPILKETKWL